MPLPKRIKASSQKQSLPVLEEDFEKVEVQYEEESLPSKKEENIDPYATETDPFFGENKKTKKKKSSKFTNKSNKKLLPVGNKIKDYDDRKDISTAKKVQRGIVLAGLAIIIGLGVKNTFWPTGTYTPAEIETIAKESVGVTNFPTEKGQAFAENFIRYYVNLDEEDSVTKASLYYFYTGEVNRTSTSGNISTDQLTVKASQNKQRAIGMPITFETINLTDFSANYKISVLVTDENGQEKAANGVVTAHWLSFSVNVYYNEETGALSIHRGSPVIIPSYEIQSNDENPDGSPIGNGEEDTNMKEELRATIEGYWKAYSTVTVNKHIEINQYIPKNADVKLYSGFGGTVKLATDTPENDISYKVYGSTESENEWKVDVVVNWMDNTSSDNERAAIYTSRYIMTIQSISGGKYVVTRAAPYLYV